MVKLPLLWEVAHQYNNVIPIKKGGHRVRKRPAHICLRTTEHTRAMVLDTAEHTKSTQTEVLEAGIILARRHYQRYGTLNLDIGARNGDNVL